MSGGDCSGHDERPDADEERREADALAAVRRHRAAMRSRQRRGVYVHKPSGGAA